MSVPAIITKLLPAVSGLVGRMFGSSSEKAEELREQVKLTEAQAFDHGRVAPRYVFQYVLAVVFGLSAVVILVDLAWPELLPGAPSARVSELLSQCAEFFVSVFGE